jgi:CBS domain-containing protein
MLPVMKKGKLVGIVTDRDLKRASASAATSLEVHELLYLLTEIKVKEVMTKDPFTVDQSITLAELESIFEEHDFNGVPVVVESLRLIGMITKLDLLGAFDFSYESKVPHYNEIMSQQGTAEVNQNLMFFKKETHLTRVLSKMVETEYKSFPVLEGHRLVGIISREDVLKTLKRASQGEMPAHSLASAV